MWRIIVCGLAFLTAPVHADPLKAEQVAEWRAQIRANFFIPEPLPTLEARVHRSFEPAVGVKAEAITYSTEFGTRVPAILYLPNPMPKGKIPGFVVVNGHGGDKYSWYSFFTGITYARAGAAVLTYDQAGEGERSADRGAGRKSKTHAHDGLKGDEITARRLCGLMMTDAMQAVSYLASRPEVDAARIGAGGYSLGSFVLALTGAVDKRLRACVLTGGGNLDGANGFWDSSKKNGQGLPYRSLNFLGDRPAVIYALHAERGPTLIINGLIDSVVNMDHTPPAFFEDLKERTVKLRGTPDGIFETGFIPEASHRPNFLTRAAALWLKHYLDFPNWTETYIAQMPETHISEWAKSKGVFMDKLYATQDREGGLNAVGSDVPGYQREDLSVFTPQEWEKHKSELVLETWVDAAKAMPKP